MKQFLHRQTLYITAVKQRLDALARGHEHWGMDRKSKRLFPIKWNLATGLNFPVLRVCRPSPPGDRAEMS